MNDSDSASPLPSSTGLSGNREPTVGFSPLVTVVAVFTIFFVLAVAIHVAGFASPMIYDSHGWILGRANVFEQGGLMPVIGIVPVRPLSMATLYLNYVTTGMDPWWFRLSNALILALSGCALSWMLLKLLEIPGLSISGTFWEKRALAFSLGLLFVAHPLQTFVVLYIWQRHAILACFFFFCSVAIFVSARSGQWRNTRLAYGMVGLFFFIGLTSKENLFTLPVVLLAAELLLFPEPLGRLFKKIGFIALLTAPAFILYMLMTHGLHRPDSPVPSNPLDRLQGFYALGGISLVQVLLTECRVFFSYLMMMVLPFWHPMQLLQPQIISESVWDPPSTALALAGVVALLGSVFWFASRNRLIAFGILFTVITIAPESLFIPQYLYFAHRAVLPMAGVWIVGAAIVLYVLQWARERSAARAVKPVLAVMLAISVVSLVSLTAHQARRWTPVEFWRAAYAHIPKTSLRLETIATEAIPVNLGAALIDEGDFAEAAKVLREAVRLNPDVPTARLNLGLALCKSGSSAEGIKMLEALAEQQPQFLPVWTVLADALIDETRADEAVSWLRKGIQHNPETGVLEFKLAGTLIDAGNLTEAIQTLNRIAKKNPYDPRVRLQMGRAMIKAHNWPEAIKQFSAALEMDPGSMFAMQGLVLAQRRMKEAEDSLAKLQSDVQAHPESADAHERVAVALLRIGNVDQAIVHFKKALELEPNMDRARVQLGMALLSAGRSAEAVQYLTQAVTAVKGNAELHYALGLALKGAGRQSEAIQQFKEALAIDPSHSEARDLLKSTEQAPGQSEPRNAQQP